MNIYNVLKKLDLLLVDDDQWVRDSLGLLFELEGCRLRTLATAEEGLKVLKTQTFDLILVDYHLPGIDGLEFIRQANKKNPRAHKILVTAYGSEALFARARKLGVRGFITKPFTSKTIEACMRGLLRPAK
jgi:DNA-binding response OmpR family regulator